MANDPYVSGVHKAPPYSAKRPVEGELCAILTSRHHDRGLELIPQPSRAFGGGEVHEILRTSQREVRSRDRVDEVFGLGFVAITAPGLVLTGDQVTVGDDVVGVVVGFDETHYPNHYNIVVAAPEGDERTGEQLEVDLDQPIHFRRVAK